MSGHGIQLMLDLLESSRLEVQLVPLNPNLRNYCEGGMKRVCSNKNCTWYRRLCAKFLSSRKRNHRKPDTRIKRRNILRILKRLADGRPSRSKYAEELVRISYSLKESETPSRFSA